MPPVDRGESEAKQETESCDGKDPTKEPEGHLMRAHPLHEEPMISPASICALYDLHGKLFTLLGLHAGFALRLKPGHG